MYVSPCMCVGILAYAPRHPIIWRYLLDAVAAVHGVAKGGVVNATGPTMGGRHTATTHMTENSFFV